MSWDKVKLGEIIHIKHGWAFKGEFFSNSGDLIVVTPGNFFEKGGFKYTIGKEKFYTDKFPNEYLLLKNDLVIAMTEQADGLLGSPALIPENNKFLHNQRIGLITILDNKKVNKEFIYHVFFTEELRLNIGNSATGTKVRHTAPKSIYKLTIKLPPLNIQQKIVNLISNYDNLIENNNTRIKLLENMAEELYKEWFVRLRFPNYQNTKIVDGIPDGWEEKIANDFFDISIGKTPPRIEPQWFEDIKSINNTKWLSIKDIGNSGMFNLDSNEYLTNESISKFNVKVVPIGTILLSFKLTIGKICIVTSEVATNEAIAHFLFNSRNEIYREYLYLFFDNYNFQLLGNTSSIATAINSKIVKAMKIIIPNKIIIKEFSNFIKPIFNEIQTLQFKNQNLKETRDLLLPRLISGKLDIKDMDIV